MPQGISRTQEEIREDNYNVISLQEYTRLTSIVRIISPKLE